MECPRCRLLNPPSTQRCDCGYDFDSGQVKTPYMIQRERSPETGAERAAMAVAVWVIDAIGAVCGVVVGTFVKFYLDNSFLAIICGLFVVAVITVIARPSGAASTSLRDPTMERVCSSCNTSFSVLRYRTVLPQSTVGPTTEPPSESCPSCGAIAAPEAARRASVLWGGGSSFLQSVPLSELW